MVTKKVDVFFYNGYNELTFLCNTTDRQIILAKIINRCTLLNLNRIMKIFHQGVVLPANYHFWVVLMGLHVTGLQVRGYVFLT